MKKIMLGKSSISSTRLSYGCMRVSGTWDPATFTPELEKEGVKALLTAYDAGYTLFDHADIYGQGLCETVHGKVLRENPSLKAQTLLVTKCGIRWQGDPTPEATHRYDFSYDHIVWSTEQSLKRLGVDCIDLLLLHRPDFLADPPEIARAFSDLKKQGKVKEFGVSNFRPAMLMAVQSACPMPLIVNQVEIHPARLDCFTDGTLDQCLADKISPMAWSPLAGGLFGDGGKPDPKDLRAAEMTTLIEVLDKLAALHGVSRTVLVLAWLLRHPSGIIPVVGTIRPERIKDAAKADSFEMGRETWYQILLAARGEGLP
jgi:predicted oxidoreductase